ncbi:hypothetical protein [Williamsia sp. 1135]|uniref:AbiTii domain-containing protein n=1 Tax=Williamsia sp. 1135 TaxID=1889262 RepID=UPI000A0FBEEE|nr:hypothetical protein [Williamsia sp. 1135]ORM36992.1 hypothetical protein BFL43_05675 [Williamsia sp. 1135]
MTKLELEGYPDSESLPKYRCVSAPLYATVHSGPSSFKQLISKLHVPERLWEHVPDSLNLRQSIDEIEQMAEGTSSYTFSTPGMLMASSGWTHDLGEAPFRVIENLYFSCSGAQLRGVVGAVRTVLVDMVGDLTADLPMASLPTKETVDAAVNVNVYGNGDHNHVEVGGNANALNVGTGATQNIGNTTTNPALSEVTQAITALRTELAGISDEDDRADAEHALTEFEEAVTEENPDESKIRRAGRFLVKILTPAASAGLVEAATGLVPLAIAAL